MVRAATEEPGTGEAPANAHVDYAVRIAGRYLVLGEIARGGMGVVLAVLDESTGRRVALKRLGEGTSAGDTRRKGVEGGHGERDVALHFRLEYAMLSRLRHPSIIEVYDYGLDRGVPYYTMELLDGRDLREVAPVPYGDACRQVRDVASSLALLHAHRLVHRDVSPRNVRVTAAGRCKLFDLGTLTPFGVPPDIAGTPSSVAPEALCGGALDHRADLYSLGALLYWLLTGHEAFAAQSFDELPALLDLPLSPPSAFVPGLPAELDALVRSLLSRDPLARPSSAAEVIERLDSIAKLPPEEHQRVEQGYLLSAKTVGRKAEAERIGDAIERALTGSGGAVLVRGERGLGKTRLLREAALHGKLRGATVLAVEASLLSGPGSTARALGARLLELCPLEAAAAAEPWLAQLASVLPEFDRVAPAAPKPAIAEAPGELRVRVVAALKHWFLAFAERRPLVVVVDDLDLADGTSTALVTSLAAATQGRSLAVVGAARPGRGNPALLDDLGDAIHLGPLDASAITALAESLFGDVPHGRRLARWLTELSHGSPLHVMDLLHHLVHARVVRYADGGWTLPDEMPHEALPRSVEEATEARIERLRPAARALSEALSVVGRVLTLPLCMTLAETDGRRSAAEGVAMLDELVSDGVLVGSAGQYRFSDESLRERLLAGVATERRARLHLEIGEALLQSSEGTTRDVISAGWHLLRAGDEERGAAILSEFGRRLVEESDDTEAAVPALEAALPVLRTRGRPPHELVALVGPLATAAFFVDRRLADRYGAEAMQLFAECTGLARAGALRESLGERRSLGVGIASAAMERRLAAPEVRPASTHQLLQMFLRCATSLTGVSAVCLDAAAALRIAAAVEPLNGLGERHGGNIVHRAARHVAEFAEGALGAAKRGLLEVLADLGRDVSIPALPDGVRRLCLGGALQVLGTIESLEGGALVLGYAARLESLDLRLYEMAADQLRMAYHAHRGEVDAARRYRERVDAHAAERGSAWQVDVWEAPVMLLTHIREGNVLALRRSAERLARLASEIPSLVAYADTARAAHLRLRGETAAARSLLEGVVDPSRGPFLGRGAAVALLADACNADHDHAAAERLTSAFLSGLAAEDRAFSHLSFDASIQLAHALVGLGDAAAGDAALDRILADGALELGRVPLGLLREARAEIALLRGDSGAFEAHCDAMQSLLRPTNNPSLVSRCERLRQKAPWSRERHRPAETDDRTPTSRRSLRH